MKFKHLSVGKNLCAGFNFDSIFVVVAHHFKSALTVFLPGKKVLQSVMGGHTEGFLSIHPSCGACLREKSAALPCSLKSVNTNYSSAFHYQKRKRKSSLTRGFEPPTLATKQKVARIRYQLDYRGDRTRLRFFFRLSSPTYLMDHRPATRPTT